MISCLMILGFRVWVQCVFRMLGVVLVYVTSVECGSSVCCTMVSETFSYLLNSSLALRCNFQLLPRIEGFLSYGTGMEWLIVL